MKTAIHPEYFPQAKVVCSCGNTWVTGSTQESVHTDLCYKCHPFYTGEQRIVDTEGQVERFYRKLEARQQHVVKLDEHRSALASPEVELVELGLTSRALAALAQVGITHAKHVLAKLETGGEPALLAVTGFGRKSMIDLRKALRARGFESPGDAQDG
ncbi:MAG: 50S ribosomal protein L31 [Anaerolineales bacterium]|jgi:large subunit ribosomal protein L31|nr:50S ribosomal protein L31 [Anaerolineales bacterium]MDP7345595.1 50S ribosomal protein L31 [Anaerolineales bacterium]MDP7643437.1 50S ribosomal protein L31 [Anaerolineales bacterium]HJN41345.1 50S ribosomal protein L31 [Anaerolineales bacterium]|tara:strand:- start:44 stop:514 length:471 start_codon:yes stop_codon:yes gene_type:complete